MFEDLSIHRINIPLIKWIKRLDKIFRLLKLDLSIQHHLTRRSFSQDFKSKYDVYHSHLIFADQLLADEGPPNSALVSTLHGDYIHYAGQIHAPYIVAFGDKVQRIIRKMDSLVYISEHQRELFVHRFDAPIHKFKKIYNGFERPQRLPSPNDEPERPIKFVMVARGLKDKGWLTAIEAFLRLRGDANLKLVGEGDHLEQLRASYPDPRIDFIGFHPNPTDIMAQADVFLFPSVIKSESLPTVVVEALSCGLPVVSTDVGEVKRMITTPDGQEAGQLVPIGEGEELVSAFSAAMQLYLDDPGLRADHWRRAHEAFNQFDMDRCAREYLDLFEAVLSSKRSAGFPPSCG